MSFGMWSNYPKIPKVETQLMYYWPDIGPVCIGTEIKDSEVTGDLFGGT